MGDGYGPIVVRKRRNGEAAKRRNQGAAVSSPPTTDSAAREFLAGKKVAVPGKMTSAFLALQLFLGEFDYVVVPFDHIFDALYSGQANFGLIIHDRIIQYANTGIQ